jgi:hypothetical protein
MRKVTFFKTMLATVMLLVGSAGVWGQSTYNLVTSTSDLVAGGKYIIVTAQADGGAFAMGLQNASNRAQVAVTIAAGSVTTISATAAADVKPFEIMLGGSADLWTLFDAVNGGYLYAGSATANQLKNKAEATTWTISFASNAAVLTSAAQTTRNILRYNSTNNPPLFSCYSSGQAAVYLYKLQDANPTVAVTPVFAITGNEKSTDTYFNSAQVALSSSTAGASIYYTTNGDEPTTASSLYSAPFNITTTTTVKAFAVKEGLTNSAVAVRTITIVPPATATVPYTEAFNNTLGDWYAFQVAGAKPWVASANGAFGNGFGGGDVESWLISPLFVSPLAGLAFSFNYASKYPGNPISVKISQNYIGYGSPTAATWTELATIAAPTVEEPTYPVKASGNIIAPLSGNLHFALVYDNDVNPYSDWRITNANVVVAPAPNTPTITITEVSMPAFTAIVGKKDTADIHVSAVNLTADVSLVISGTDAAMFAVAPATLAPTSGTLAETLVNVIYQPTAAGTHTATLTISSAGATSKVYDLSGKAFVVTGAGTVDSPFTVADVKTLNNALAAGPKYWVAGYIIGVPSAGNAEGNLTAVALTAPFTGATAIALSDAQNETDLTKMIGVQLPDGAIRTALNLKDNVTNLNKMVKVYGTLQAYFSAAPGVQNTSDYVLEPNALPSVDVKQFKVYTAEGKLHVNALENEQITVIDILGKQVYSNRLKAGLNVINLPSKGIMVVKIANTVTKVIL